MLINTDISAMWSTLWSELANITKNKNTLIDPSNILIALSLGGALAALSWARRRSAAHPPLPPGPRGLPLVGYLPFLGTELHHKFMELARVYGPIFKFRLGNKLCMVISSPALVKEVLRDKDAVFANHASSVASDIITLGRHDIAFSPNNSEWKRLRKVFVRDMVNNATLNNLYGIRKEEVGEAVRFVKDKIGRPVDIGNLVFMTTMNSVISMACSRGGLVVAGEAGGLKEATAELMRLLGKPNVADVFPALAWLDLQGIERDMKRVVKTIYGIFDSAIEDRRNRLVTAGASPVTDEGREARKDFLQFLLELNMGNSDDDKTEISDDEVKTIIMDTVIGGTDTTTSTVEWTIAELLKHPNAMNKVQQELTKVVGLNNKVEESHLPELTYLNAVIMETLRLHPPLPFLIPRYPSQSTTIGGYEIPKGTQIFVNIWAIHRDPSVWDNPLEFAPERFLVNSGPSSGQKFNLNSGNGEFNYLPFGSGRRVCPGIPLADRLVAYLVATLLHLFEWKVPHGTELEFSDRYGISIKKRVPVVAVPTPRSSHTELYNLA